MKKKYLILEILSLIVISCKNTVSLKSMPYKEVNYSQLDRELKDIIKFVLLENQDTSIRRQLRFITFQNKEEIKIIHDTKPGYGFRGVEPTKFQYKNYEFIIDFTNSEGSYPFILYKNKFYFKSSMNIWNEEMLQKEKIKVINMSHYFSNGLK